MKNIIKILEISLILIFVLGNLISVQAAPNFIEGLLDGRLEDKLEDKDITMDTDIHIGKTDAINSSNGMIRAVLGIMQVIGSLASVIALIVIGFRYMFSSLQEKAEMKGVLIYYIIGAVLVFATSNILGIAYDIIIGITM